VLIFAEVQLYTVFFLLLKKYLSFAGIFYHIYALWTKVCHNTAFRIRFSGYVHTEKAAAAAFLHHRTQYPENYLTEALEERSIVHILLCHHMAVGKHILKIHFYIL